VLNGIVGQLIHSRPVGSSSRNIELCTQAFSMLLVPSSPQWSSIRSADSKECIHETNKHHRVVAYVLDIAIRPWTGWPYARELVLQCSLHTDCCTGSDCNFQCDWSQDRPLGSCQCEPDSSANHTGRTICPAEPVHHRWWGGVVAGSALVNPTEESVRRCCGVHGGGLLHHDDYGPNTV
jgi:hypothetical protein